MEKLTMDCDEAAKALGISTTTARKLCREGRLPGAVHISDRRWIISKEALKAAINKQAQGEVDTFVASHAFEMEVEKLVAGGMKRDQAIAQLSRTNKELFHSWRKTTEPPRLEIR